MILTKNGLFAEFQVEGTTVKSSYFFQNLVFTYIQNSVSISFESNNEEAFNIYNGLLSELANGSLVPYDQTTLSAFFEEFGTGGSELDESIIYVSSLSNLPLPINNVITLPDLGRLYYITKNVNLQGDQLVVNTNIVQGLDQNTTGFENGTILINQNATFRDIQLTNIAMTINAVMGSFDWRYVNFVNCPNALLVQDALFLVFDTFGFINSPNFIIDCPINSLIISPNSIWRNSNLDNAVMLSFTANAIITGRVRIEQVRMILKSNPNNQKGIYIDPAAQINKDSFILSNVFIENGLPPINIDGANPISVFTNVNATGIVNSKNRGRLFLQNVAQTATTNTATAKKLLAITQLDDTSQKLSTDGTARVAYLSSIKEVKEVKVSASLISGNNQTITLNLWKNGVPILGSEVEATTNGNGRAENMFTFAFVELQENDYVEVYVQNLSNNNILVSKLNVGLL